LAETVRLLEEFISDSQHRLALDDPDYHSFDEEEDLHWNQNGTLKNVINDHVNQGSISSLFYMQPYLL